MKKAIKSDIATLLIERYGITQGTEIALQEAQAYLRMKLYDVCEYESKRLNYDLRRIKERSEGLYFDFCYHTGICCPICKGSWNRLSKKEQTDTFLCQLCFYEWPRTGKNREFPLACHSSQNSKKHSNIQNM